MFAFDVESVIKTYTHIIKIKCRILISFLIDIYIFQQFLDIKKGNIYLLIGNITFDSYVYTSQLLRF